MNKNHIITDFMCKDHAKLKEIFDEFRKNKTDIDSSIKLFHDFRIGLQRHIVWEEEILFTVIEDKNKSLKSAMGNANPIAMLRMQHTQIKDFLNKIQEKLDNKNVKTDDIEDWLIELLADHNNNEEDAIYPWIDEIVDEDERREIFLKTDTLPKEKYYI